MLKKKVRQSRFNVKVNFVHHQTTSHAGAITILKMLANRGYLRRLPGDTDRIQGWLDGQMLLALILLNIFGYDHVSDVDMLENDKALGQLIGRLEPVLFGRRRTRLDGLHRGGRKRVFPSPRSIHDWLSRFHDAAAGVEREYGTSYIPRLSEAFHPLQVVWKHVLHDLILDLDLKHLTIDIDATIIASGKGSCLRTYRAATGEVPHERGYQPMMAYCPELGMILHQEFRDGHVSAKTDVVRFLEEALMVLPEQVSSVNIRMDGAGYQMDVIKYCNRPSLRPSSLRRFGRIGFVVSAPLNGSAMDSITGTAEEEWCELGHDLGDGAEIVYVPNSVAGMPREESVRFVAYRRQVSGLGIDADEVGYGLMGTGSAYRLRMLATNYPSPDEGGCQNTEGGRLREAGLKDLIEASNSRCGRSEHAHSEIKSDFAGGMLPSNRFGSNRCWLMTSCVSYNIVALFRRWGTKSGEWLNCRMKRLRVSFFQVSGRLVHHANRSILNITTNPYIKEAWERLDRLEPAPP